MARPTASLQPAAQPTQAHGLLLEAQEHMAAKRWDPARQAFERVLRLEPGNPEALHGLGTIAFRNQDPQGAIRLFMESLASGVRLPFVLTDLGYLLMAQGQLAQGIPLVEEAHAMNPHSVPTLNLLALARGVQERHGDARDLLLKATALEPANTEILANLGSAFANLGDWPAAKDAYERVLGMDPDHAKAKACLERMRQDGHC